jgi:Na+/H+ antiporter NhaD/arsenite permease-like protein
MARFKQFFLKNPLLVIFGVLAVVTMFAVPMDEEYLDYFDWHTLSCVMCILAVASDVRSQGLFKKIAQILAQRMHTERGLVGLFMLLCGVMASLISNDVTLLIMLPLAATTLMSIDRFRLVPVTFTLMTAAANLCGMIMPSGNPHNLYLFSYYDLTIEQFLEAMWLPFAAAVLMLAIVLFVFVKPAPLKKSPVVKKHVKDLDVPQAMRSAILFVISLLGVFRILPVMAMDIIVITVLFIANPKCLRKVDWTLILTFTCFFVFSGNMARIPQLSDPLSFITNANPLLAATLVSQVISNVPASVLLSHFTTSWQGILVGADIAGVGSPVGSMATIITIRTYSAQLEQYLENDSSERKEDPVPFGKFMATLLGLNVIFLTVLVIVCLLSPWIP